MTVTYLGLAQVITSTASMLGFWYIQRCYWKIITKVVLSLTLVLPRWRIDVNDW